MEAVEVVKDAKVLFLGRGISAPVAKEGALKRWKLPTFLVWLILLVR